MSRRSVPTLVLVSACALALVGCANGAPVAIGDTQHGTTDDIEIALTVTDVQVGTVEDLHGFQLTEQDATLVPWYVHYEVSLDGDASASHSPIAASRWVLGDPETTTAQPVVLAGPFALCPSEAEQQEDPLATLNDGGTVLGCQVILAAADEAPETLGYGVIGTWTVPAQDAPATEVPAS